MSPTRRDDRRLQQRRQQVAQAAARLIAEGGLADPEQARRKAAHRLGISDSASLPGADEIREAVRTHQRLYKGPEQAQHLLRQRQAALQAMTFLAALQPRLVGPVLDGSANQNTPVCLHLHPEDPDAIALLLQEQGIPAQQLARRLRLGTDGAGLFPCWQFEADGIAFEWLVLPATALRQAPLDSIDGKPMDRASLTALRRLLDAERTEGP